MKLNLNKNTILSIILLLCLNTSMQSFGMSFPMCSVKEMRVEGLKLIPQNTIHSATLTLYDSKPGCMDLSPRHHNYLSGQLISSSLYSQHIQSIHRELTPEEIRTLVIQQYEHHMTVLNELCALENPEIILSSPHIQYHLQVIQSALITSYNDKATHRLTREKTLSRLAHKIKFVNALRSGKVAELLEQVKHPKLKIAEAAFNELNQLWPYEHEGSFLNPDSYTRKERKFIEQISVDVMQSAEGKLISNPSYIAKYADQKSRQQIQAFDKKCLSLQQQGNRKELHRQIEILRQAVKKNGKKEDFATNASLAIAIKTFTAPITTVLDDIAHAPCLSQSRQALDNFNKAVKDQAHQENIFRETKISELLIEECSFDPRHAAEQCHMSHRDYMARFEGRAIYDPVEFIFHTIKQRELPAAHAELMHFKKQLTQIFEQHNITEQAAQKEFLIKEFNKDIATQAHNSYTTRSDVLNIAKLFTPIDVQNTTVRILNTSSNTQSLANDLQTVADTVLDNARLCQVECVPQVEECIVESLRVLQKSNNVAETIYHVTVVDHLLTDMQTQSHSVATGMLPNWQRSSELLAKGLVEFIRGLNPIPPAIDLALLSIHTVGFIGKGTFDFIRHPLDTTVSATEAIGTTTSNVVSALINTAQFACDLQLGDLYLPHEEYLQRCEQFAQLTAPLDHITTDDVVKFSGHALGTFLSPWAVAKVYTRLNQIDAIGKISNEVKVIARGIKTALEEHPSFVTTEGIVLKMSNGAKNVGNVVQESTIGKKVIQKVGNMKEFFELPFGKIMGPNSFKTNARYDGQSIYQLIRDIDGTDLKKGYFYYLDNLHKDHIEIFNKKGNFIGVFNLDGSFNMKKFEAAKNQGRNIKNII